MLSLFLFFILFGGTLVGCFAVGRLAAEYIIEKRGEGGRAVREVVVVTAATLLRELIHLLGEVIRAQRLHQLRQVAALHEVVHLVLHGFEILIGNAHLADEILNRLYAKLFGAAEAIAHRGRVLGAVVGYKDYSGSFSASGAKHNILLYIFIFYSIKLSSL